jgi:hypothetical protein
VGESRDRAGESSPRPDAARSGGEHHDRLESASNPIKTTVIDSLEKSYTLTISPPYAVFCGLDVGKPEEGTRIGREESCTVHAGERNRPENRNMDFEMR